MNAPIRAVTPSDPVCFGVCCPRHYACARYAGVDDHHDDAAPIDTCIDGGGHYPLFLATSAPTQPGQTPASQELQP